MAHDFTPSPRILCLILAAIVRKGNEKQVGNQGVRVTVQLVPDGIPDKCD